MPSEAHVCETCELRLLELVCGDLSESEATHLRVEARACPSCAASLERLDIGMSWATQIPLVEPSPNVDAAILQVAAARFPPSAVLERSNQAQPWAKILEAIRAALTGPQLAMITVALLVVAIGLWIVPGDPAQYAPAAESTITLDPDTRASEEERPALDALAAPMAPEAARTPSETRVQEASPGEALADDQTPRQMQARRDQPLQEHSKSAASDRSAASTRESAAMPARKRGRTERSRSKSAPDEAFLESAWEDRSVPLTPKASRPAAPSGGAGLRATAQRSAEGAPAEEGAAELHQRARSLLDRDQCSQSVQLYRKLLTSYPGYSDTPEAILEASDCYQRLGRYDEARMHLRQASTYPAARQGAQRRLRSLKGASRRAQKQESKRTRSAAPADDDAEAAAAAETAY